MTMYVSALFVCVTPHVCVCVTTYSDFIFETQRIFLSTSKKIKLTFQHVLMITLINEIHSMCNTARQLNKEKDYYY